MNDRPDFGEYEFQLFNTNQPMEKPETVLSVKHANRAFDEWLTEIFLSEIRIVGLTVTQIQAMKNFWLSQHGKLPDER